MSNRIARLLPVFQGGVLPYYKKVIATAPLAYWIMGEASGTAAVDQMGFDNGAYNNVTLGQPGIGDGNTCPAFSASDVNIYSAALNTAYSAVSYGKMTMMVFCQIATAVWEDSTNRWIFQLRGPDTSNRTYLLKDSTNNRITASYIAGGTNDSVAYTTDGRTTFFNICMTVDVVADEMKFYFNGAQVGTTQTGLGTWSGEFNSARCVIGADSASAGNGIVGNLAHAALWTRALTPLEVASICNPF